MNTSIGERMNQNLKNTLQSLLKTELRIVHITTNNKVFLHLNEAVECEFEQEINRNAIKEKEKIIMKIYELLSKVLSKNEWGVFFKGEPLQNLPMQEGTTMYKVNEVSSDRIYDAINKEVEAIKPVEEKIKTNWKNTKEEPTDNESSIG